VKLHRFFLLFACFHILSVPALLAYQPDWIDVVDQFQDKIKWERASYEAEVQVFDPFRQLEDGTPLEIPHLAYKQLIHWKNDEYLTVETMNLDGVMLHYFYEVEGTRINEHIAKNRLFEWMDLRPYYIFFFSHDLEHFRAALKELEIPTNTHTMYLAPDGNVYHRFGHPEHGPHLLMNTAANRIDSINFPINAPDGSTQLLSIRFKNFEEVGYGSKKIKYPMATEFYLADRLFQRRNIKKLKELSRLPWRRLKQLAEDYRPKPYGSMNLNYRN